MRAGDRQTMCDDKAGADGAALLIQDADDGSIKVRCGHRSSFQIETDTLRLSPGWTIS
jgi:hypothetical protein